MRCLHSGMQAKKRNWSGIFYRKVYKWETGVYPNARLSFLPALCNHCTNAPCVDVCPVGATEKQANGLVIIDENKCIGCRYCMVACPYNVRQFVASTTEGYNPGKDLTEFEKVRYAEHQTGVVEKCNFCQDRLAETSSPCVSRHVQRGQWCLAILTIRIARSLRCWLPRVLTSLT